MSRTGGVAATYYGSRGACLCGGMAAVGGLGRLMSEQVGCEGGGEDVGLVRGVYSIMLREARRPRHAKRPRDVAQV